VAKERNWYITVEGASKDAPFKLLDLVLCRLLGARFVTISTEPLTREVPCDNSHTHGGASRLELQLGFDQISERSEPSDLRLFRPDSYFETAGSD